MNRLLAIGAIVFWISTPSPAEDETGPMPDSRQPSNLPAKTLGGTQFWSDVFVQRDWRIQRNAWTGHYRLLDGQDVRRAWGSQDQCRRAFDQFKHDLKLQPVSGKVVVVLHGLGRTRRSMAKLCQFLSDAEGYTVINVTYASTRESIDRHAVHLGQIIKGLEGAEEINFVAHSMGNLVVRHYLGDRTDEAERMLPDSRIQRIVMLGPPNNGSHLAKLLEGNPLFQAFFGVSGRQLSSQWNELAERLATPRCEFGIVAGGRSRNGSNPLLEGDDDLIVSVSETRLIGARDFVTVPVLHTFLMDDPKVHEYVLRFLWHGYFLSEQQRQPIAAEPQLPADRAQAR